MEAERLPELQDFVNKHEKRVAAAVAKQAIDAAIKEGLSRQRAEEIFGDLMRGVLAPAAQGQQGVGFGFARHRRFRQVQVAAGDDDQAPERVSPLESLYGAAQAAAFEVGGGGRSGSSGRGGASVSSHFQSGSIRGQLDSSPTSAELQLSGPGHKLIVTRDGDSTLTIRVETDAEGDASDQLLRIRQTEKAFRARREKRFTATIEAFRLTEDVDYLKSLLDGVPADDAAVIRSRLDRLATGK